jgi:prolipoprotein diacylglyceryltransferase
VVSVAILAWLARRHGFNAETMGYAQVLGVLGVAIAFVLPAICEPRGLPVRGYGMMMLLAVISGMALATYRARRVGVDPEMIFTLAFWMILPGILGARLVYVVQYWQSDFWPVYEATHKLSALVFAVVNVAAGGLVVYGSFLGGMVGLGLFWMRYRIPLLATLDLTAPSMLLGLALGRVGCMLNGCCYGGPCDLPWKVTFPWNSPVHQHDVETGAEAIAGVKFSDGEKHSVMIKTVVPDSPAARAGLTAGTYVLFLNSDRLTSAKQARAIALGIDKLQLTLRATDGEVIDWAVDDPPASQTDTSGMVKIYGLEVTGSDGGTPVVSSVRRGSPEMAAGIRAGQQITNVSGYPVASISELRERLDEHRRQAWLRFDVAGHHGPITVAIDRPLPRSEAVHPTQLYSAIDALILVFLLLAYDPFRRRDGALSALMMTIYPITRFLIESIRTDEAAIWGTPFTISQNISLAILAVGICLWIYILRRPAKLAYGG